MTDDPDSDDVAKILSNVQLRDLTDFRSVGHIKVMLVFELDDWDAHDRPVDGGGYALEIGHGRPSLWFHDYEGDTETLWKNKPRR